MAAAQDPNVSEPSDLAPEAHLPGLRVLREVNGRLFLTGVSQNVRRELERSHKLQMTGPVEVFEATPIRGHSTRGAYEEAEAWLVEHRGRSRAGTT